MRSFILITIALLLASLITWASSQHGLLHQQYAIFMICALLAFIIQWLSFIPAWFKQTERYFDITGSMTYLSVMLLALFLSNRFDTLSLLLTGLVSIWALRLGSFLFSRIHQDGSDHRFDEIKPNFFRFLSTWTLQGLWVVVTAAAALTAITAEKTVEFNHFTAIGLVLWSIGFSFEVIADSQKRRFKALQTGSFIQSGLWAYSRHPNYFGEILLWLGIAVIAYPHLQGWQHLSLISPIFVYLLLTKLSGINMLEATAQKRWGDDPTFQRYVQNTPILFPKLKRS